MRRRAITHPRRQVAQRHVDGPLLLIPREIGEMCLIGSNDYGNDGCALRKTSLDDLVSLAFVNGVNMFFTYLSSPPPVPCMELTVYALSVCVVFLDRRIYKMIFVGRL